MTKTLRQMILIVTKNGGLPREGVMEEVVHRGMEAFSPDEAGAEIDTMMGNQLTEEPMSPWRVSVRKPD